ncbi:O-antigen ligase family protein [Pelagibacteraceae bacterium]|nr:O-antigen ligase family protein [Pelagibacteraceae bacterium]
MISNLLLRFQLILICLIPLFLILGPALSDIAASLTGSFYLVYFFLNKDKIKINKKIIIIFLIFYFYIIASSVLSDNIILSLESSLFYFRFLFLILSFELVFSFNSKNIKYFFYSLLFTFILLIVDSYYQYFNGYNLLGYSYDGERLSGLFNEEKKLGSYLSRLTPVLLGLSVLIYGNSRNKIFIILFIIILVDILVLLSGERSSIFYIFLSTFIIALCIKKWKYFRVSAFFISLLISVIIIYSNDQVKNRVIEKTLDQTNILNEKINAFSIQHQVIYSTAIKIYKDNLIFGIGPKLFREKCKLDKYKTYTEDDASVDGCQTHPHNTYIQLLVETGTLGFLFIFSIFIFLNFKFLNHIYNMIFNSKYIILDQNICFLTAIYVNLWPIVPTGNFFNNWLSIIYFIPIGLLATSLKSKINN